VNAELYVRRSFSINALLLVTPEMQNFQNPTGR